MSNNSRIVPVPERSKSVHAVFTGEAIADEPPTPVELPAVGLLRRLGSSEQSLTRLAERPHAELLLTDVETAHAGAALAQARLEALRLAEEFDGVVIDLSVPRTIEHAADDTDLNQAAQWVAMELDQLVLRSRGLEAFGLPELVLDAGEPSDTAVRLALAMGVAHQLIGRWPADDPVGPASITLRDIAYAYGDPAAGETATDPAIDVLISYTNGDLAVAVNTDPHAIFA